MTETQQNQEPTGNDLTQTLETYLRAETDVQARTILETHPELLTDPQAEALWQQVLRDNPTVPQRITTRHKLWKRKRRQRMRHAGEPSTASEHPKANEEIQWQPISKLSDIAGLIDGMYADDQEQHRLYLEAREKPHVLDDATIQRAVRLYTDRLDMLTTVFAPQLARWQADPLTDEQRQEVERLTVKIADLRALDENIMALLKEIEQGTIDAVMRKSDLELGIEAVYGKTPLTDQQNQLAKKIDEWVKGIEQRGGGDEQILKEMYDYMPTFKQIMDGSTRDQMDKLCAIYPGFYRFATLLNDLASGMQNGTIKVPR